MVIHPEPVPLPQSLRASAVALAAASRVPISRSAAFIVLLVDLIEKLPAGCLSTAEKTSGKTMGRQKILKIIFWRGMHIFPGVMAGSDFRPCAACDLLK
jgi:hypothetical protein